MTKKLTKHGNDLAVIIDKPFLERLKINAQTALEIAIENDAIVIRPVRKTKHELSAKEETELIIKAAEEIMDEYADVFEKLAK